MVVLKGWLDFLPGEIGALIGIFTALVPATAILYRTVLFCEMITARRLINLFGVAIALLIVVVALLLVISMVLFGFGIIGPE